MNALLVLMLVIITGVLGHEVGRRRGRKDSSSESPHSGNTHAASYQAGYLAGHLAGWRDAEERRHGTDVAASPAPSPPPPRQRPAPVYLHPPVQQPAPVQRPAPVQQPAPVGQPAPVYAHPPVQQPLPARPPQSFSPVQGTPVANETPEAAAARKAKRDQQNINVTLYVASLLLVAAGALFVGTSLPGMFRFVGIGFITALFYLSGLMIHARVPRLQPAAVAFVGTGLALIPVTGLAMYSFVLHSGPAAWLVTSAIGTIAYAYTAVRLDNKVLAFLSLSFVVSTAWSGVSILGGALVWYFTAMIGLAILLTLGALLRPRWLPPLYVRPLMVLHPYVVPVVALAVTLTPAFLAQGEYALVMFMCGTYFTVMLFVPGTRFRLQHFYGARGAYTLALVGLVWDLSQDVTAATFAGIVGVGVQAVGVAYGGRRLSPRIRWADAVSCLGLQLFAATTLTVVLGFGSFDLAVYVPLAVTMLTAMVLGWTLGNGTEFSPAAVLGVSVLLIGLLGAWPVAALLVTAGAYWFLRAVLRPGSLRQHLILAGRIALTAAVPAAVAGVLTEDPVRVAVSVAALVAAAGVQQVAGAVLERGGVRLLAPRASAAGFGGIAIAGLLVLPAFDDSLGNPVVAAAALLVASSGVATGLLLFPWGTKGRNSASPWRLTLGESMAPVTLLVTGVVAAASVSLTLGNLVLLLAVAYFVVSALRIPLPFHRQCYWWLTRAAGTLLLTSAYSDATNDGWGVKLAGEVPAVALVVVIVAALQLTLPLLGAGRRLFPRASMVDAGVLVALMAAASTYLTAATVAGAEVLRDGWQPGVAAIVTAVAAAASGAILRRRPLAWLFAPAALVILVALRIGNIRDIEILLGIFVAYSGFMVGVVQDRSVRGGYLVALRILSAAFITLVVADATESPTAVSIAVALVLVLQHGVTLALRGRGIDIGFHTATAWAVLGAQFLLPFTYLLTGNFDGGGRWVVMLELALVPVSAAITWRLLAVRGSQYFGTAGLAACVIAAGPALVFPAATWLHAPLLERSHVSLVLLGLALAVVGVRAAWRPVQDPGASTMEIAERLFWLISALGLTLIAGVLAVPVSFALTGLSGLVLALALFAASHVEKLPALYAGAAPVALLGAVPAVEGLLGGLPAGVWVDYIPWLVGGAGTALVLYAVKMLGGPAVNDQLWRRTALSATAAAGLAATAVVGLMDDATSMVGFALVVATGVLVVREVPAGSWLAGELFGLASVAALQRAVLYVDDASPQWFWSAQWYVMALAVVAGLRYMKGRRADGLLRLCLAAGLLSLTSIGTIFGGTSAQQVYVLVAHVVLLAAGLLLAERLLLWWGAAGVVLSVMWALRSYAFAMLALVALLLIVLAVWRLNRKPPTPGGAAAAGDGPASDDAEARSHDGIR